MVASDISTAPVQVFAKIYVLAKFAAADRSCADTENRSTNARSAKGQVCARHTKIKKAGVLNVKKQVSRGVGVAFANMGGSGTGAVFVSAKIRTKKGIIGKGFRVAVFFTCTGL